MAVLFEEKNGYVIVSSYGCPTTHKFKIVDFVPLGYTVWNIGPQNMPYGYLPLCRLKMVQPFDGGREIETDTLKAIKIEGAHHILDAVGYGPDTLEAMEKFVAKYENKESYQWRIAKMKKALPIMRQIKWR